MNAEQLSKVGSDLVRRCGTRDPFQIAKELGRILPYIIFPQQGFLPQKFGICAVVFCNRVIVYITNAVRYLIQKIEIMGNH